MKERTRHLKIKIISLMDEAQTIRGEAKKVNGMEKWRLNHHRTSIVRPHARHSLLAYGLLRGVPYSAIEHNCYEPPRWGKIEDLANRFGGAENDVDAWIAAAKEYVAQPKVPLKKSA